MQRRTILLSLLLSLPLSLSLSHGSIARADEPSVAATSGGLSLTVPIQVERRWYGWQPLMVDLGSIATMVGGAAAQGPGSAPVAIVGAGGFVLGAPLIHLGHEHVGKAAGSLALRTLVPLTGLAAGLLIGEAAAPPANADLGTGLGRMADTLFGGFVGLVSGALVAATIDDVVLAREDVRPPPPPDAHPTIEPRVSSVRGGATIGVGGTF